jgi:hypothetical protein
MLCHGPAAVDVAADWSVGRTGKLDRSLQRVQRMDDDAPQWDPRSLFDLLESCGRNLRTLSRKLERFSQLDLCRYQVAYDNRKNEVNPHYWEECHPYLTEECSEDSSEDFAEWVVSQGAEFYHEVAAHPERIQQYLETFSECESGRGQAELRWDNDVDRDEYRGYQSAQGIAMAIYRSRYGANLLNACYDSQGPREGLE